MAIGIAAHERLAVAKIAIAPANVKAGALQCRSAAFKRLRAAGAKRHMADAGCLRCGELQAVALVIVPAAQIDRVALRAAYSHPEHVDEERAALLELGREQFHVPKVRDIEDGLWGHTSPAVSAGLSLP